MTTSVLPPRIDSDATSPHDTKTPPGRGEQDVIVGSDVVIPSVATVERAAGEVRLQSIATVAVRDVGLRAVADRFRASMRDLVGIELPRPVVEPVARGGGLTIELERGQEPQRPTRGIRADGAPPGVESSSLVVSDAAITVRAATPEGAHRALTSLLQMAAGNDGIVPCGTIDDAPELAWRGLSLDVVRTFVPVDEVKRVIDMLSLYKLNVLHLHLTDNEGWRLEIESRPRLTEVGARGATARRPGGYYTRAQFRELVDYARERFVTVVPEIDVPGHSRAALAAYPELARPGSDSPNLDPASEDVWRFVHDVMHEVATLSPAPFLHIGGDEAFGMPDDEHAAFVRRTIAIVKGLGKRVVGWQEICRGGVGPDDVVQYWIDFAGESGLTSEKSPLAAEYSPEIMQTLVEHFGKARGDLARIAEQRAQILLSPNAHLYLDRPHADASTVRKQERRRARLGLPAYPASSLEEMFEWDPLQVAAGVEPEAVVGIEAAMWCETVETMDDLEVLLLPRLAGVAEAAWSPSRRAAWAEHRNRLGAHARLWRRAGWSWFHAASVDWVEH
jgi:hexosaminidase